MEHKIVEVTWIDAKTWSNDWIDGHDLSCLTLPVCTSWGMVIKEDKNSIFLSQTASEDDNRNIIGIHRGSITRVRRLK